MRNRVAVRTNLIFACEEQPGSPKHNAYKMRLTTHQVFIASTSSLSFPGVIGSMRIIHPIRVMSNLETEDEVVMEQMTISIRDLIMSTVMDNGRPAFIGLNEDGDGDYKLHFINNSANEVEAVKWGKNFVAKVMFELMLGLNVHPEDVETILRKHFSPPEMNIALQHASWDGTTRTAHVSSEFAYGEDNEDDEMAQLHEFLGLDMSILEDKDSPEVARAQMNGLILDDAAADLASAGTVAYNAYQDGENPLLVPTSGVTWTSHVAKVRSTLEEQKDKMNTDTAEEPEKSGEAAETSDPTATDAEGDGVHPGGSEKEGGSKAAQATPASDSSRPVGPTTEFAADA